jgi:hypothetical protein
MLLHSIPPAQDGFGRGQGDARIGTAVPTALSMFCRRHIVSNSTEACHEISAASPDPWKANPNKRRRESDFLKAWPTKLPKYNRPSVSASTDWTIRMATSSSAIRPDSDRPKKGVLSGPLLNHKPETSSAITEVVITVPSRGRSLADKRFVVEKTPGSTCSSVLQRSVQAAAPVRRGESTPQPQPNAPTWLTVSRSGESLAVDLTSCAISVDQGPLAAPSTKFLKLPTQCQGLSYLMSR